MTGGFPEDYKFVRAPWGKSVLDRVAIRSLRNPLPSDGRGDQSSGSARVVVPLQGIPIPSPVGRERARVRVPRLLLIKHLKKNFRLVYLQREIPNQAGADGALPCAAPAADRLGRQILPHGASRYRADCFHSTSLVPLRKTAAMQPVNFEQSVDLIVAANARYRPDAYFFVRDALDYTKKMVDRSKGDEKHVSGKELLNGIRAFAIESYGPMAATVLEDWGIRSCADFGEIVFIMIEHSLLAKSETDSRSDFNDGFDFGEAFIKPFLPSNRTRIQPKQTEAKISSS